jgi:diguanylate cyclase (GGDEF)-like protein/PAS domain S-box-containing protein
MLAVVRDVATAPSDLDELLRLVCARAVELTGAGAAAVEIADGSELVYAATAGTLSGAEGLRLSISESFSGECLTLGERLVCEDVRSDPRVDRAACERLGIRSIACLPLLRGTRRIGVLELASPHPHAFSSTDGAVIEILTEVASARLDQLLAHQREQLAHDAVQALLAQQGAVFDAVEDGLILFDSAGILTLCNPAALRLLGLSRAQFCLVEPRPDGWGIFHEDGRPCPEEEMPAGVSLRTGEPQRNRVLRIRHADDNRDVWVRMTALPVLADDGSRNVVVSFNDVTERRRQTEALEANEQLLRLTMDNSPTGIVLVNLDRTVQRVNAAFCRMLGYSAAQFMELGTGTLVHPDDSLQEVTAYQALLDGTGTDYRQEVRYQHADGHYLWVEAVVTLVRDDRGTPLRFLGQFVDVTARRAERVELQRQANTDPLTGAVNRRGWKRALARAEGQALARVPVTLAFIDHDHFKSYNDTYGHPAGDAVLRDCAQAWRDRLRGSDTLARLGGEEFAILLPDISAENAEGILRRLAQDLPHGRTVSIGYTQLRPGEPTSEAVSRADRALYQAKEVGRNRIIQLV